MEDFIQDPVDLWERKNETNQVFPSTTEPETIHHVTRVSNNNSVLILSHYIVPVIYMFLFAVGSLGNSLVVYVSWIMKRGPRSVVDLYVGNLAVADLFLIFTLPFWSTTHLLKMSWVFGDAGCRLISGMTHVSMFGSIFFITAMALDRYMAVVKAVQIRAKSLRNLKQTSIVCMAVWIVAIFSSLPAVFLRTTAIDLKTGNQICKWSYPAYLEHLWWAIHIITRNCFGFLIPMIIICRCYYVIIKYVHSRPGQSSARRKQKNKESSKEDHINRLVVIIIVAFVVCWLPNQTSNVVQTFMHYSVIPKPKSEMMLKTMFVIHTLLTVLSFTNSIINPIIYSTSPSHRAHIKKILHKFICCCRNDNRNNSGICAGVFKTVSAPWNSSFRRETNVGLTQKVIGNNLAVRMNPSTLTTDRRSSQRTSMTRLDIPNTSGQNTEIRTKLSSPMNRDTIGNVKLNGQYSEDEINLEELPIVVKVDPPESDLLNETLPLTTSVML